jgi:uncharacterized protein (TIGR02246 family)
MSIDPIAVANMARDYTAAWNAKSTEGVAGFFAEDADFIINRGKPWLGRAGIAEMSAGFHRDVPDLVLTCDEIRVAGEHAIYVWTFTGHDAGSGNPLRVRGWEEWEIGPDLKIRASRGWYDAADYARQVAGG